MGNISYLTGQSITGSFSFTESVYELKNSSILFTNAWLDVPKDLQRAGKVSAKAMEHLDHIVNEVLRARDTKKSSDSYLGTPFEASINITQGLIFSPVTRPQQQAMIDAGPGNGCLPGVGLQITLERLLNKIKHRHHQSSNFRIENNRHIFLINTDKQKGNPDSIVEFDVLDFCNNCSNVAAHL